MTTPEAARRYLAEHMSIWGDRKYQVYNPNEKDIEELPWIIGFNNGGSPGWFSAVAIAEDGHVLAGHICSEESYMYHDLGIVEGATWKHDKYQEYYPDGYRMDFVPYNQLKNGEKHEVLEKAIERNQELAAQEDMGEQE